MLRADTGAGYVAECLEATLAGDISWLLWAGAQ